VVPPLSAVVSEPADVVPELVPIPPPADVVPALPPALSLSPALSLPLELAGSVSPVVDSKSPLESLPLANFACCSR